MGSLSFVKYVKLPRFSMDVAGRYLGNTGYAIPRRDYYLLGILRSGQRRSGSARLRSRFA